MSTNANALGDFIDAAVLDRKKALQLLASNPDLLRARRGLGETALHFLAVENFVDAVRFLASGADVNVTNQFGDSPLIDAATLGNAKMAEVLLSFGADPNAGSETRDNVLDCAVRSGNSDLVRILLEAGANWNYITDLGQTVFDGLPANPLQRQQILAVFATHGIKQELDSTD